MKGILTLLISLLIISACGTKDAGINLDTTDKKYLAARTELNLLLEQYIKVQDQIPDTDHQRFKNAFKSADFALDIWERNLTNPGYDYSSDIAVWLRMKSLIIDYLKDL